MKEIEGEKFHWFSFHFEDAGEPERLYSTFFLPPPRVAVLLFPRAGGGDVPPPPALATHWPCIYLALGHPGSTSLAASVGADWTSC